MRRRKELSLDHIERMLGSQPVPTWSEWLEALVPLALTASVLAWAAALFWPDDTVRGAALLAVFVLMVLLAVASVVACPRITAADGRQRTAPVWADGHAVRQSLLSCRRHRWCDLLSVEDGGDVSTLRFRRGRVIVPRGTGANERILGCARALLAARRRGLLVPGDAERLAESLPEGALSLAESPEPEDERGLSRVDS